MAGWEHAAACRLSAAASLTTTALLGLSSSPLGRLQVENFQIVTEDGRLENLVKPLPGVRVRACAACGPEAGPLGDDTRTAVEIDQVRCKLRCACC